MKQYNYTNVNETPTYSDVGIKIIVDSNNIDDLINGYSTLKVQGRELLSREVETRNYRTNHISGKKRSLQNKGVSFGKNKLLSSSLASRVLKITYELDAIDHIELLDKFETLNYYLNREEVKIVFTDDPNFFFVGTFTTAETVRDDVNKIVSSYEFECMDAFKFSNEVKSYSTSGGIVSILNADYYPVALEEIVITTNASAGNLTIRNTTNDSYIKINHNFVAGSNLVIDMQNYTAKIGDVDVTASIDIFCNIEEFTFMNKDRLTFSIPSSATFKYREVLL